MTAWRDGKTIAAAMSGNAMLRPHSSLSIPEAKFRERHFWNGDRSKFLRTDRNSIKPKASRNFHGERPAVWAPNGKPHRLRLWTGSELQSDPMPGSCTDRCVSQ